MATEKTYNYKGYKIEKDFDENGKMNLWTARPIKEFLEQRHQLEKQKITRAWHGNECFCSECTYTEEDIAHNQKINDELRHLILSHKVNSITCNTMKECKKEIDNREQEQWHI